jgi:hypothetical protein
LDASWGVSRYLIPSNHRDILVHSGKRCTSGKSFEKEALAASHTSEPRVINVDKNAAYPKAIADLKATLEWLPKLNRKRGFTSLMFLPEFLQRCLLFGIPRQYSMGPVELF